MTTQRTWIINANIVKPHTVEQGSLLIEESKIVNVMEQRQSTHIDSGADKVIDAQGMYVMPGMIDTHSDAIEKEVQPRPDTYFPLDMSVKELEKKLAGNGITSMYHSFSLTGGVGVRSNPKVLEMVRYIHEHRKRRTMIRHHIHLRYETVNLEGIDILEDLLERNVIDMLSYMDHTPGQGQYTDLRKYKNYVSKTYNKNENEIEEVVNDRWKRHQNIDWDRLRAIAVRAAAKKVTLASHDDDNVAQIDKNIKMGMKICEFPVNRITAHYAHEKKMLVSVGAPNVVRGVSHSNNLSAMDAIKDGVADILCSDYLPSSMLPAVFKMLDEGLTLAQAVAMVTLTPAQALGVHDRLGSIEAGKEADLLLVEVHEGYPMIRRSFVGGQQVVQVEFQQQQAVTSI